MIFLLDLVTTFQVIADKIGKLEQTFTVFRGVISWLLRAIKRLRHEMTPPEYSKSL